MAYDGITMAAVCRELSEKLAGARVEKIYQPTTLEVVLHVRTRNAAYLLVCSADPRLARVHITTDRPENPPVPPAFCMLLRKHLAGARLLTVEQAGLERIISFVFRSYDDFGNETRKKLVCELMGKHSNIILTTLAANGETVILGGMKAVNETMSRYRIVLPGEPYFLPPAQEKLNLFTLREEGLALALAETTAEMPEKMLVSTVMGLGLDLAREMIWRASKGETVHLLEIIRPLTVELCKLAETIKKGSFEPCIVRLAGQKTFFSPLRLKQFPGNQQEAFNSVNECLDAFYLEIIRLQKENELRRRLELAVSAAMAKAQKKLRLQQEELHQMEGADRYRIWGELLTASLHMLQNGMLEANVPDYYNSVHRKTKIPLNPAFSPQENAQRYFKKYRKLRDGEKVLRERLEETNQEIHYLDSLQIALEHADLADLHEIREEMEAGGLIRLKQTRKRTPETPSGPLHFVSADGIDIYVGKNNRQNDQLTLRAASPGDTWLHVKDIPGSHVLVKSSTPPAATLLEAARLAARYSKAAASANVPVDYTLAKHVRKPKRAKPGMVIYDHHRTLYVTPDDN